MICDLQARHSFLNFTIDGRTLEINVTKEEDSLAMATVAVHMIEDPFARMFDSVNPRATVIYCCDECHDNVIEILDGVNIRYWVREL